MQIVASPKEKVIEREKDIQLGRVLPNSNRLGIFNFFLVIYILLILLRKDVVDEWIIFHCLFKNVVPTCL